MQNTAFTPVAQTLTTQLSSRGQLVIPKVLRDAHAWGQDTVFVVREHPEGVLLTPAPAPAAKRASLDELIGCVQTKVKLSNKKLVASVSGYADGDNEGMGVKW